MRKFLTLTLFIFFIANLSFAQSGTQPKNSIKFGLGSTYLKPGEYFDNNTIHFQYERSLFRPVYITVNGFKIEGGKINRDGQENSILAYQADLGLNIALFSNENNALKIGGGTTWQNSKYRYTTSIERDSNNQIINKVFAEDKEYVFGWITGLEYEVFVAKYMVLGARITYKQYQNGDKNYFFGLNAGFRF
jgi:hypothetical protein